MRAQHHHWIDGRPHAAPSGDGFEVKSGDPRAPIGRWPRAGARELDLALEATARGEGTWSTLPTRERRRRLEQALERFVNDRERDQDTMAALGCTARELDTLLMRAARAVERAFAGDRAVDSTFDPRAEGANVVLLDWTEGFLGPTQCAFGALLAGRAVVLVSDARVPMIADALAAALAECAGGALAVLHDDGRTIARAAFQADGVARLHVGSTSDAGLELASRAEPERTVVIERGFGAGLEVTSEKRLALRALSNTSFVVRPDQDLVEQAEAVVTRAFGRVEVLSGFAPGRIGRVIVPARSFSRFTEALLEVMADDPDVSDPLTIARVPGAAQVERAFALGHDEGATAIFTGSAGEDLPFPLVFTNVEERMKLARMARPAPVLCLMRVADPARAREVALRIDV